MRSERKRLLTLFGVFLYSTSLTACQSLVKFVNYTHKREPRYISSGVVEYQTRRKKTVKVVSYNIKHAKRIDEAIRLITNNKNLAGADVILLQEMTPAGIKKIAKKLHYNYVFYPAVHHPILKTGFGNAILSKWPVMNDHKVILPPIKKRARNRIAVGATLLINGEKVLVYSLHMGVFVNPQQRESLVKAIVEQIPSSAEYCVIAGDFNSFTFADKQHIKTAFLEADFDHSTGDVGWTYSHWYFLNRKTTLDHIFIKGMNRVKAGKVNSRAASDHLPIWAELSFSDLRQAKAEKTKLPQYTRN